MSGRPPSADPVTHEHAPPSRPPSADPVTHEHAPPSRPPESSQGWTASVGTLALVADDGREVVIADFARNPNHLVRGSVATAPEGERVRLLSEAEFLAGTDPAGMLVVLGPETPPRGEVLTAILDRGGRGLVTDFTADPFARPHAVPEIDDCREDGPTRPFVAFALSPFIAMRLRTLVAGGAAAARITSDAIRPPDTVPPSDTVLPLSSAAGAPDTVLPLSSAAGAPDTVLPLSSAAGAVPHVSAASAVAALRAVGVREGDLIVVHSSLSALGHVAGGTAALLAALATAVGASGTVLLPAFTCSLRIMGVTNKLWRFRPFDPHDPEQVKCVGILPRDFLRTHPDAPRSAHVTTSWTGFGPSAAACLAEQGANDPPYDAHSPLALAAARGGKVVFLGADVTACTYLHVLEERFALPGLATSLASVKGPDGRPYDVAVPRQAPGPREFYRLGEDCRFFVAAKAAGLAIRRAPLGKGLVKAIDLASLDRIGSALLRRDPTLLGLDRG